MKIMHKKPAKHQAAAAVFIWLRKNHIFVRALLIVAAILPYLVLLGKLNFQTDANFFNGNNFNIFNNFYLWGTDKLGAVNATGMQSIWPFGLYFLVAHLLHIPDTLAFFILMAAATYAGMAAFSKILEELVGLRRHTLANVAASIFFFYNIYVAVQLRGSFLFVIAHCLTAVYLLLVIRAVKRGQPGLIVIASVVLSVIAVTNLVFSTVALFLVVPCYAILLITERARFVKKHLLYLALHITLLMLLIVWFFIPSIAISGYSYADIGSILASESFYNLDSGVLNVIRGLGYWAFFGSHNGELYYAYSNLYRNNPVILLSLVLPLAAGVYLVMNARRKSVLRQVAITLLVCLLVTFLIIGGTHAEWPTAHLFELGFEKVAFLNAFRNTYKFTSASVFLLALVAALLLWRIANKTVAFVVTVLLLAAAFPIAANTTFSERSLVKDIPGYWKQATKELNEQPPGQRALLLPDQYFSAYDWHGQAVNPPGNFEASAFTFPVAQNSCKGCGPTKSLDVISLLTKNYADPGFAYLAAQMSIDTVIERNDFNFGYYSDDTPQDINDALTSNRRLTPHKRIGALDIYRVQSSLPLIYSPANILQTAPEDSLAAVRSKPFADKNKVLVDQSLALAPTASNYYATSFRGGDELIAGELAISPPAGAKNYTMSLRNKDDLRSSSFLSPRYETADGNIHQLAQDITVRRLEGKPTDLTFAGNVRSIQVPVTPDGPEQLSDSTFTKGKWASKSSSCAGLGRDSSFRTSTTSKGLLLSSYNALACTNLGGVPVSDQVDYVLSIDASVISGDSFGFCIFAADRCVVSHFFTENSGFKGTKQFAFSSNVAASNAQVYLYSDKKGTSKVLFKKVSLKRVKDHRLPRYEVTGTTDPELNTFKMTSVERPNPTEISMRITGKGKGALIFQESSSSGWSLRIGNKTVPAANKFVANYFANGWLVNLSDYCGSECTTNADGTMTVTATLRFLPQKFAPIGILISGVTLLGCLIYLLSSWYVKKARTGK